MGAFKFLFSLYLKEATECAFRISLGRSFYARIDEGKNDSFVVYIFIKSSNQIVQFHA